MTVLFQILNTLILIGMIIVPFAAAFYLLKKIKEKHEENEKIEIRLALIEKRVLDLEEYIENLEQI